MNSRAGSPPSAVLAASCCSLLPEPGAPDDPDHFTVPHIEREIFQHLRLKTGLIGAPSETVS
jgi:hypothetical protein